jgi:hypothetical protein
MNDTTEIKYGIEDLWTLLQATIEIGNVAGEIVAKTKTDGTIAWYDKYLFPFAKLGDDVIKLFSVNYKEVIPQFKDLDDEEKAELLRRTVEKLDIPQDKAEIVIEKSFLLIFKLGDLVKEVITMIQELKKPETVTI